VTVFGCVLAGLFYFYYSTVYFSIVLCIVTVQPGTRISFGINKVLSYLILSVSEGGGRKLNENKMLTSKKAR